MDDDRNNNNDDDDDGPGVHPTPPLRLQLPNPPCNEPGEEPELNDAQCFLLQRPRVESTPEPMGQQVAITTVPQQATFLDNVRCIFPEVKKIVSTPDARFWSRDGSRGVRSACYR